MWTREELRKRIEPIVLNESLSKKERSDALSVELATLVRSVNNVLDRESYEAVSEMWNSVMIEIIDDNHLRRH